jgi:hypothetical protein
VSYRPGDQKALDKAAAEEAERKAHALEIEIGDVLWLMGCREGRRTVRRLLDRAGVLDDNGSFEGNAMKCSHDRGREHVVWRLYELILRHCPDARNLMLDEAARGI